MKTDAQLQREVTSELARLLPAPRACLRVTVKDGVASLVGETPTYIERWNARQAALRVPGVVSVEDDIEVCLAHSRVRPDREIARTIQNVLWWTGYWRRNEIRVKVYHGWVTLSGDIEWDYQKRTAVSAIADLTGVAGVIDNIIIKFKRSGPPAQCAAAAKEPV